VTTFWAYLNELTVPEQSKRLYGIIGAGAVTGGLVANLGVYLLVEERGTSVFLAACAVITAVMALITQRTEVLANRPDSAIGRRDTDRLGVRGSDKKVNAALEGAKLVQSSKYLVSVVAIVFLYELVSQILDYQVSTAAESVQGAGGTQAFYGQLGSIVGVISLVTQLFLVSFIIRRFGMTSALLVLPLALSLASGIYLAVPVLWTAGLLFVADGSFAYSINQTAREMLLVPTSSDVKYKARAFINMFVQRTGKGAAILMAIGLVFIPVRFLSILALVVIAIWIGFASFAGQRFRDLTEEEF
jgi:AAA family ATP:ADP antiporter